MSDNKEKEKRAINKFVGNGYLKSADLKRETVDGKEIIKGSVEVYFGDRHTEGAKVYVRRYNVDGTESKTFAVLNSILSGEVKSIANILEHNKEYTYDDALVEAGKLYLNFSYSPFQFLDKNTDEIVIHGKNKFRAFVISLSKQEEFVPKMDFQLDGHINGISNEKDKEGNATGRGLLNISVPLYEDIVDIDLVVKAEHKNELSAFSQGKTALFYGNVLYETDEEEVEQVAEELAFGENPIESKTVSFGKTTLVLTGAKIPYSTQDEEHHWTREEIEELKIKRAEVLQQRKEEQRKAEEGTNSGTSTGNSSGPSFKFS